MRLRPSTGPEDLNPLPPGFVMTRPFEPRIVRNVQRGSALGWQPHARGSARGRKERPTSLTVLLLPFGESLTVDPHRPVTTGKIDLE